MSSLRRILITFILILLCALGVSAAEYGEMEYMIEDGSVTITDVDYWYSGDIVIPSKIDEKAVTKIASNAFQYSKIKSIVIPSSVKTIESNAFSSCSNLETVVLNDGLETIGYNAFSFCSKLTTFSIPSSVTHIGSNAFEYCSSLTAIAIPKGVSEIAAETFDGCSSLTKVYIPNTVTSISSQAFGSYSWDLYTGSLYYAGSSSALYSITSLDLSRATVVANHKHSYTTNIVKATKSADGLETRTCTCGIKKTTKIRKVTTIKLSDTQYIYDGKTKTPNITVKDSAGKKLVKDKDYTIKYPSGRKAVGTYSVVIKLKGNYSNTTTLKFKIYSKTKSLKLSDDSISLCMGQKVTLKATVSPSTAIQKVTFTSSNKNVVKVNEKGELSAVKAGKSVITVKTADKVVKKCVVKVYDVKLNYSKKTINIGQKITLKPTNSNYKIAKWTTSNSKVATVDKNGVVKGVTNGKVTITAKLTIGVTLNSTITVKKASLSKTLTILKYDSETLTLQNASGTVKWSSSDTKVAKVSSAGKVTGVSKGTAVITATCGGVKYTCKVTVKNQAKLVITYVDWDTNSVGGVEPQITIRNNTNKDVKYISIYTSYKNRWGDPVYCEIRDTDSRVLKVNSGLMRKTADTFYWDPVIYNNHVSRIDFDKMVVTYVDNTKETIYVNTYWYDSNYYYR